MHGIALPHDDVAAALDGFDVAAQHRLDLVGSVAGDQSDFPDVFAGVYDVEELDQLVVLHRRADLDADWVLDTAEVFNVTAIDLPGAVSDPQEVSGSVVPALAIRGCLSSRVASRMLQPSRQALFVLQNKAFVAAVQVDGLQLARGVCSDCAHEAEGVGDTVDDGSVLGLQFLVAHMSKTPVHGIVQIGDTTAQLGTYVVHGRGRVEVRADKPVRVDSALIRLVTVQNVAAEAGHLLAIHHLSGTRSRLRILSSNPANADYGLVRAPNQDQRHLKEQLEFGIDRILGTVREELGAITTL